MTGFLSRIRDAVNARLVDDWHKQAIHLPETKAALFWGAVTGLAAVWPAFAGVIPLWAFAGLSVLMCMGLGWAKLTKQPGVE